MKVKKLKPFDIIRFIISLTTIISAIVLWFAFVIVWYMQLVEATMSPSSGGSAYMMIIVIVVPAILAIAISIPGILGLIRFFLKRKKDVNKRGFSVFGLIAVNLYFYQSIISIMISPTIDGLNIFLLWVGIFLMIAGVIYLICDIIEIIICKKEMLIWKENQRAIREQMKYCANCGNEISTLGKYCGNCGNEIK